MSEKIIVFKKDQGFFEESFNLHERVYDSLKKKFKGDNDILILCQNQVCYFDETFSELKYRVSRHNDLIICVQSLSEIVQYYQYFEKQQMEQIMQIPEQQTQNIQQSVIQSKINSQILEQKLQIKTNEKLLGIVTGIKKSYFVSQKNLCESVIQYGSDNNSQIESIVDTCFLCNTQAQTTIQLECFHKYHEECLESLFYSQLQNQSKVLHCACSKYQKASALKLINDEGSQTLLKHKLLQNQLNGFIQNNKLEKCQNPTCYFYYLRDNKVQLETSFCPLCLN
ncbi:unnamed protein product [Paramecium octaurelia]|uniref:RING-type domain-containing protein n=1 Tax=Paramecium octaurelia TaxID=43137 RepID=A0A8S1TLI4_PAROT|nr:unnamed protein product [Paramecium octaurelia]